MLEQRRVQVLGLVLLLGGLISGCATTGNGGRTTSRDQTAKGAAIGAGAGALLGAIVGEGEADEKSLSNMALHEISLDRLQDRRGLLASLDDYRRLVDASEATAGADSFSRQAFDMVLTICRTR